LGHPFGQTPFMGSLPPMPALRLVAALGAMLALALALSQPSGAAETQPVAEAQGTNFARAKEPPLSVEQPWRQAQTVSPQASPSPLAAEGRGGGFRPASGTRRALRRDALSPTGCLIRVGEPVGSFCEPCPPLSLGGNTVFCAQRQPITRPTDPRPRLVLCAGRPIQFQPAAVQEVEARFCSSRFSLR
jgi:hypothetical protein